MSNINLCDCEEHWIEIKNKYDSLYLLSSKGRLYSYKKFNFIEKINKDGYCIVGCFFSTKIHRLVYQYFNKNNSQGLQDIKKYNIKINEIDHINTIRNHNCICNLNCGSRFDNNNNPLTKKKKSLSVKGKNNPMFGKIHNKETKQKISENKKGIKLSEKTIQKKSKSMKLYWNNLSEEKKKIRNKSVKGKKNPMFGKKHNKKTLKKISENRKNQPKIYYCDICNSKLMDKANYNRHHLNKEKCIKKNINKYN